MVDNGPEVVDPAFLLSAGQPCPATVSSQKTGELIITYNIKLKYLKKGGM